MKYCEITRLHISPVWLTDGYHDVEPEVKLTARETEAGPLRRIFI